MSYDLEILAKIENGQYIRIAEPKYSSPTYNLGKMFRIAMDWDFDQGTIYNVADILDNIKRGISELERYTSEYFIPELIEDEDIIFNKDSDYLKQKKKEKKNPVFKRKNSKK